MCYAYYYKKPAIFNNDLNDKVYRVLEKAPLIMIVFMYWMLGNRQMFYNEVELRTNFNDILRPNHNWFDFSKGVDHTAFILLFFPIFMFYEEIMIRVNKIRSKLTGSKVFSLDMVWNEYISSYWECLIGQQQKRWFTKELFLRETLNIK